MGRAARSGAAGGAARPAPPSEAEAEAIRANVDRAAQTLNEILEEVSNALFVSEATAMLSSEAPEISQAEALRSAVATRLEWLDANFLAALNAYCQAAQAQGDEVLMSMLVGLREEVLRQVG